MKLDLSLPPPPIGSKWRHADGGLYVVTGRHAEKHPETGEWYLSVDYQHADGTAPAYGGLSYGTHIKRWHERFTLFASPSDTVIRLG
jgi:hypothetical protein